MALKIPNSVVCVPESEYDDYVRNYGEDRVISHPDSIIGIGKKRRWILEKFKNVFMIDDEFDHLVRCYLMDGDVLQTHLTPEETYDVIQSTAQVAKELGTHLFGFSKSAKPLYYNPQDSFGVQLNNSNLIYCGIGVLDGGKLFFAEDIDYHEDTFINLLNCFYNRYCFVDKRYSYPFNQNDKNGMTTGGRDFAKTEECAKRVKDYFGQAVKLERSKDGALDAKIGKIF